MKAADLDLVLVRDLARKFVNGGLSPPEDERTQRMLIEACGRVAGRHGLDAQRLYWEALGMTEKEPR